MLWHWLIEYRTYTCKEIKFYIRSISEKMSTYQYEVDIFNIYTSVDAMMATPNNLVTPYSFSHVNPASEKEVAPFLSHACDL